MRVGSLFSGAGGFDLGFHQAGFEPMWFCEIDPTARAVLARHWPEVPCYEDIRQLDSAALPRVDVLIGGPPCQDFSVAGKRAGLAGERSGLFWEYLRLVAGLAPEWLVAENVPGILSQNKGRDLGAILGHLDELGYGWAFRVLDAQHWGVPQRRRRVFIVGHSGADTRRAAQVLFESDRGSGNPAPSSAAGQGAARGADGCLDGFSESGQGWWRDGIGALRAEGENRPSRPSSLVLADTVRSHPRPGSNSVGNIAFHPTQDPISGPVSPALGHDGMAVLEVAATLRSRNHAPGVNAPGRGGEDDQNLVIIDEQNAAIVPMVGSLSTGGAHSNRGFAVADVTPVMAAGCGNANSAGIGSAGDPMFAVDTTGAQAIIANTIRAGHHGYDAPRGDGNDNLVVAKPVTARDGKGVNSDADQERLVGATVRRLMPVECEALQGWPRDWTRWTADGKELADGPRYRLVGNGVAAPVARWLAARILAPEAP